MVGSLACMLFSTAHGIVDGAAYLVETGLEVFGLPFPEDAVQIPMMQEEQRVLFMPAFFTGRRGYERRYGWVRVRHITRAVGSIANRAQHTTDTQVSTSMDV